MAVETCTETRQLVLNEATLQEQILSVGASWQTAQYALVKLIAELDAAEGWAGQGVSTCASWVARALDIEVSTAREWVRIGRALEELPLIDASFEAGLSYTKVRSLTRVATRENEQDLLALSWETPAGQLGVVLAKWLMDREDPEVTARRQHEARAISWRTEPDGMVHGEFRLPPTIGKQLSTAIDTIVRRWYPEPAKNAPADASARPWPELERVAPEAFIRALIHDADGRPINASARRRHPSVRQQRVVMAEHRCCVDCGTTELLEFDHNPPFEESHHTVVSELEPRCWPCHRRRTAEQAASQSW